MFSREKTFNLVHQTGDYKSVKYSKCSLYKGLLLSMLSGAFFSMSGVIVKDLKNLHPGQLALYQFIGIFVFSLPELVKSEQNVLGPKNHRFLLVIRGIIEGTSLFLIFLAYRLLPLGDASVIIFSSPVLVVVAARTILKEPCGIFQSATVLVSLIGIIFTTKIPLKLSGNPIIYTKESVYGLSAALGALLFITCRYIVIRKLKSVHHSVMLFNTGWVSIVETAILTTIIGLLQWHHCSQGLYIIILCFLSFFGQTFLMLALQSELAGPVSTMSAASHIVVSFVWQTLYFLDTPDLLSSIGAVLVALSVILVGIGKWVSSLPKDAPCHQKLGWMLK